MKKLLFFIVFFLGLIMTAGAQETVHCFHLDHLNFLTLDASFWKRHTIASVANKPEETLNTKYFNVTELTGGIGLYDVSLPYSKRFYGINTVNGALFRKKFSLGAGVGMESYNDGWLLPLYGDARYYFDLGLVSLFAVGDAGVKINTDNFSNGTRVFVSPGAGIALPFTSKTKIVFSAGLLSQWQLDDHRRDSFINFRLGVLFKGK